MTKQAEMLMGAVVADAASLGVHWIYDPARISDIAARQDGSTAFTPIDAGNYDGVMGYFAHAAKSSGMQTQYGDALLVSVRAMNAAGKFDENAHQAAFAAHFGAGGAYRGYIDRPTRGALENIAAEKSPSGIDDDQLPAITRLPAILARYSQGPAQPTMIRTAQEATNINAVADVYSDVFADLINQVLDGVQLDQALVTAAANADPTIMDALQTALAVGHDNSTDYAETTGRACHLPMAGPLIFHILRHATDYADAIERNNRAGGDSAGRAILIGAVMGAVHGMATPKGVPLAWVLALDDGAQIWKDCTTLAQ